VTNVGNKVFLVQRIGKVANFMELRTRRFLLFTFSLVFLFLVATGHPAKWEMDYLEQMGVLMLNTDFRRAI
jgi:hypothetical protein